MDYITTLAHPSFERSSNRSLVFIYRFEKLQLSNSNGGQFKDNILANVTFNI